MFTDVSRNWLREQIYYYNLFGPDENDYDDDESEVRSPAIIVKHQLYATRLYVPLLISKYRRQCRWSMIMEPLNDFWILVTLYSLTFITLLYPQSRLITNSNINSALFDQLYLEHGATLSCPCSTVAVPYKTFVSHTITTHAVCSSIFVSDPWIQALNVPNRSTYLLMDFRTTASSQVSGFSACGERRVDIIGRKVHTSEILLVENSYTVGPD